jgi:hypothetical protein
VPAGLELRLDDRQVGPEGRVLLRIPLALGLDPALGRRMEVPGHLGLRAGQRGCGAEQGQEGEEVGRASISVIGWSVEISALGRWRMRLSLGLDESGN